MAIDLFSWGRLITRASRLAQFVTNLIGILGLGIYVLSYFAVAGSGQEEEFAESGITFFSGPVSLGATTCNRAMCKEDSGECTMACAGQTCNVPQACTSMTVAVGCRCARPT